MDGLNLARILKAKAIGGGDPEGAAGYAEGRKDWHAADRAQIANVVRAGVPGHEASTFVDTAASELWLAVRQLSVVGRLPLRRVTPLTPQLIADVGSRAHFVRAGGAIRMSAGTFTRNAGLRLKRIGAIAVASMESIRDATGAGDEGLRLDLVAALAEELDRVFMDHLQDPDADSPGGIGSGATPIVFSGSTVLDLDEALREALHAAALASNLQRAVWLMPTHLAASLALARAVDGSPAYPGLGALGGTLAGLPVLTSGSADSVSSDGESITLLDPISVAFADQLPEVSVTTDALIEQDDSPAGNSIAPTAATQSLVSMFQADAVGFRATMRVNWELRRPGAVQVITGVPSDLGASS